MSTLEDLSAPSFPSGSKQERAEVGRVEQDRTQQGSNAQERTEHVESVSFDIDFSDVIDVKKTYRKTPKHFPARRKIDQDRIEPSETKTVLEPEQQMETVQRTTRVDPENLLESEPKPGPSRKSKPSKNSKEMTSKPAVSPRNPELQEPENTNPAPNPNIAEISEFENINLDLSKTFLKPSLDNEERPLRKKGISPRNREISPEISEISPRSQGIPFRKKANHLQNREVSPEFDKIPAKSDNARLKVEKPDLSNTFTKPASDWPKEELSFGKKVISPRNREISPETSDMSPRNKEIPPRETMSLQTRGLAPESKEMVYKNIETMPRSKRISPRNRAISPEIKEMSPRSNEMIPRTLSSKIRETSLEIDEISPRDNNISHPSKDEKPSQIKKNSVKKKESILKKPKFSPRTVKILSKKYEFLSKSTNPCEIGEDEEDCLDPNLVGNASLTKFFKGKSISLPEVGIKEKKSPDKKLRQRAESSKNSSRNTKPKPRDRIAGTKVRSSLSRVPSPLNSSHSDSEDVVMIPEWRERSRAGYSDQTNLHQNSSEQSYSDQYPEERRSSPERTAGRRYRRGRPGPRPRSSRESDPAESCDSGISLNETR